MKDIKVGDKITMLRYMDFSDEKPIYTVVEVTEEWVKLKHPEIGGHFIFKRDRVDQVVSEVLCK